MCFHLVKQLDLNGNEMTYMSRRCVLVLQRLSFSIVVRLLTVQRWFRI